jgi:type I restriction enzyme S subunit
VKCIDEEIPFEIPQGWEWTRVGNIFFVTKLAGFEYTKFFTKEALSASNPIPIVRAQNVRMGFFEENKNEAISEMLSNQLKRSALNKKCLLMTFIGAGIGDTCIFPAERKNHLAPNVAKIEPLDDSISLDYAVFALMSPCGQRGVNAIKKSTAQPSLSMETIRKLLIPIPPLKEQKCISLKLSEALPLVEKYSKVQEEQNQLNVEIQYLLKKSILQEAIQGKLVPQIAEEGTAQELLEQIKFEKQKLVKEGKIKMFALNDSIIFRGDDNKYYERINGQTIEIEFPFEYPNSWYVARLKDICQLIDGKKKSGKGICLDAKYLRGKSSATIIEKGKFVYAGDNIILVDGENSGEVFIVPQDGYMGSTFKQLWLSSAMWKPYIFAFILFYKEELRNSKRGAAIPHLNKELFYNLLIGIPPLAEQQRIAERINELSQLLK